MEECGKVLDILNDYEEASGQKINKTKTTLFFSKSTDAAMKNNTKEAWGVPEIMQYEKYLGLPSFVGKGKKNKFQLHQGEGVEKNSRMGREATLTSR